jgi:hypothetical protein
MSNEVAPLLNEHSAAAVMICFLMVQVWASLHNQSLEISELPLSERKQEMAVHPSVSGYQHLIVNPCNDPTLSYQYSAQCPMCEGTV